ncbi:MAG: hypothetical protein ACM3SS_00670 [Rhodospirillaceae bacterium]
MSEIFVTPVSLPRAFGSRVYAAFGSMCMLAVSCARIAWDGLCGVSKAQLLMQQGSRVYRRRISRRY